MRVRYLVMLTAFFVFGCRSEADRMAEFCLSFEAAVAESATCPEMADRIRTELDRSVMLADTQLCRNTTACLPCKKAIPPMLARCGYDTAMKPVFDRMNVSEALRTPTDEP